MSEESTQLSFGYAANVLEVFSSVQGEGSLVGERQIFVRFYGCHLNCHFCDTPESVTARQEAGYKPARCRFEQTPGRRDFADVPNPIAPSDLIDLFDVLDVQRGLHHSVALTGGEPLMHVKFLQEFLPELRATGYKAYLETSGDLPKAFESIQRLVDYVAMDIKLPSVTRDRPRWDEHKAFIHLCRECAVTLFVKTVVNADTDVEDIKKAVEIIAEADHMIPLYLQPMTPFGDAQNPPTPQQLMEWQRLAKETLKRVRVMPQSHKMFGAL